MGLTLERAGMDISIHALDTASIANSRNLLVKECLACDATHVLFVDSDMAFPSDALHRLLAWDKDIVGTCYRMRRPPYNLVGKPVTTTADGQYETLTEFEFLGFGLILIKADVFRTIPAPWFIETFHYPDRPVHEQFRASLQDQFPGMPSTAIEDIMNLPDVSEWLATEEEAGRHVTHTFSEDVAFCNKARRFEYKIFADMALMMHIQHIGKKYNTILKNEG